MLEQLTEKVLNQEEKIEQLEEERNDLASSVISTSAVICAVYYICMYLVHLPLLEWYWRHCVFRLSVCPAVLLGGILPHLQVWCIWGQR